MRDFTKEQSTKELSFFLFPMLFSVTFQRIYSLINTAVISQYLSYTAVAVIGSCQAFVSIQEFIFLGMTTGFGFYIFRCIGVKDTDTFRLGLWGALYLTGFLAVIGIIFSVFSGFFLKLMNVPPVLWTDTRRYLFFLMAGSGFLGLKNLLFCIVQGLGDSAFSGFLSMAGIVVLTGITVLLIVGLRMGVEASALAVLLNNVLQCLCLILYLFRNYRNRLRYTAFWKLSWSVIRQLLNSGIAKSGMMILVGIGSIVMQRAINKMTSEQIAANTYASSVSTFFMYLISAYGTAAGIISGQNMGNRNLKNIKNYNRRLLIRCGWVCLLVCFLCIGQAHWILRLLTGPEVAERIIHTGAQWLCICCLGYPGLSLLLISRNALQAMGAHRILPFLGILEMTVNILLAGFVPYYGPLAVSMSVVLKWSIPGIISFVGYHRIIKKHEAQWAGE